MLISGRKRVLPECEGHGHRCELYINCPERQNVETHVNTVCPLTVVNCDFHYAGCEVQLVHKDMPTHLAESLPPHLSLLALHNQQLTQLTIQQKESLEELKMENKALKQKVNGRTVSTSSMTAFASKLFKLN